MKKIIKIEGMNCGHCTASVEKALKAVVGVTDVSVDLSSKSATVEVENVSDETLKKTVVDTGFEVAGIE